MMMMNYSPNPYVTLIMLLFCHTLIDNIDHTQQNTHMMPMFSQKRILVTFRNDTTLCPDQKSLMKLVTLLSADIIHYVRMYNDNTVIFQLDYDNEFCAETILQNLPFVEHVEEDHIVTHCGIGPILLNQYELATI